MGKKAFSLILIISLFLNALLMAKIFLVKDEAVLPPSVSFPATSERPVNNVIDSIGDENPIIIFGTVKKEPIPPELELGDYWYWIYFDEPYLLVNNSAGVPMYIDKIEAVPPRQSDFYNIDEFIDRKVELYGYQTWGYAESSVFQILAIREL